MTQPNPLPPIGDELVKQNGTAATAVDAELDNLRRIIDAERQRANRLGRWTRRVWLMVGVLIILMIMSTIVYMSLSQPHPTQMLGGAGPPNSTAGERSPVVEILGMVAAAAWMVSINLLPLLLVAGVILSVMTYMARRTAGMHEIRASLASIDAQLRMLALAPKPPPGKGETGS